MSDESFMEWSCIRAWLQPCRTIRKMDGPLGPEGMLLPALSTVWSMRQTLSSTKGFPGIVVSRPWRSCGAKDGTPGIKADFL
jgi:hypothetical protein